MITVQIIKPCPVGYVGLELDTRLSKENKSTDNLTTGSTLPLIKINILPTQLSKRLISSFWEFEATSIPNQTGYVDIPGPLKAVEEEHANWYLSWVKSGSYKNNIKRAHDITLENCLNLGQIHAETLIRFSDDWLSD
ncbi:hypothetical protein IFM47457_02004 [Aspergillus lentulus]|nr:hypothetical protein IFM47457_02004 [Aspergillus lentulus]